jgi:hypothetical protein
MECAVASSRMRAYVRSDRRPEQEPQRGIMAGIKARAGLASSIYISFLLARIPRNGIFGPQDHGWPDGVRLQPASSDGYTWGIPR